jgi:hypothetical protein
MRLAAMLVLAGARITIGRDFLDRRVTQEQALALTRPSARDG